jgi:uncharacterized repeat protein (TIGR04076 family)
VKKPWAYALEIELVEGHGTCAAGHKVGDTFLVQGDTEQFRCDPLCIHALASMLPKLVAMRYGANLPWLKDDPDVSMHLCPDVKNPHTFRITRIRDAAD